MTKLDVKWALYTKAFWHQILIPTAYREYFSNEKKEILASDRKNKDIYYVFRNNFSNLSELLYRILKI